MIQNLESLEQVRAEAVKQLEACDCRILVCSGTGCIATGSEKIYEAFANIVKDAPAVDAAPVVHGRWIPISEQIVRNGHVLFADGVECSVCREGHSDRKYCEECGTKMDLEE